MCPINGRDAVRRNVDASILAGLGYKCGNQAVRVSPPFRLKFSHFRGRYGRYSAGARRQGHSQPICAMAAAEERRALGAGEVCPICLAEMRRPALAERCLHAFCLGCIKQWAGIVPTCPLCKTPFRAVLHDVFSTTAFSATWLAGDAAPDYIGRLSQPPALVRRRHVYESGAEPASVAPAPWSPRALRPKLAKLDAWLARELDALAHGSDASVLVSQLRATLAADGLDWEDASLCERVQAALPTPARAPHFLREAACFLATGFNVPTYDREVAYAWRRPALALAPEQAPESELCAALREATRRGAGARGVGDSVDGGEAGGTGGPDRGEELSNVTPVRAAMGSGEGDGETPAVEGAAATQEDQLRQYREEQRQANARRKRLRALDRDLEDELGRLRHTLR